MLDEKPLPYEKKLVVPVSVIEDVVESKKVVESSLDALIEAQDNKATDNLGPDVAMEVVKDFGSLIEEKYQRLIEDNKAT